MFNRPRCRDWTPLATQQLRLRNLIQITGHNILCDEPRSCIYYTLHLTSMSAPFFTSEKLETPKNAIWPEIHCDAIVKSTAHNICIRIWQTNDPPSKLNGVGGRWKKSNSNSRESSYSDDNGVVNGVNCSTRQRRRSSSVNEPHSHSTTDRVLFLWGVYFSGLIPITRRTDVKLKENSLVFHIHGGFFTAAECLMSESIPKQLKVFGLLIAAKKQHQNRLTKNDNCDQFIDLLDIHKNSSIGDLNELSNTRQFSKLSTSPSQHQMLQSTSTLLPPSSPKNPLNNEMVNSCYETTAYADETKSRDSSSILIDRECSVKKTSSLESPSKQYHTQQFENSTDSLKIRFIEKSFFKTEIRQSYNVEKLLLLQDKQRQICNRTESATKIMEKICMKSAFCLNLELIANKAMFYRPRGNPSMGRTLNQLLFQQQPQLEPEVMLRAQEIRRRIETARFRCRMLVQERNASRLRVRQLEQKLGQISDATIEKESWLMANYHGLSKDKELRAETLEQISQQRDHLAKFKINLQLRRQQVLLELKEIYCIEQRPQQDQILQINGAALPSAESITDVITPLDLSVALGYAAHLTLMTSIIMNCPLRNVIIHKGSASRIRDDVKMLPDNDREFPLYCERCPPPEPVRYAIFLLNQNIAQIKLHYHVGLTKDDPRDTLGNLLKIINGPMVQLPIELKTQINNGRTTHSTTTSSNSLINYQNHLHKTRYNNRSRRTIDHHHHPDNITNVSGGNNKQTNDQNQRISRSAGSYSDESLSLLSSPVQNNTATSSVNEITTVMVHSRGENNQHLSNSEPILTSDKRKTVPVLTNFTNNNI